MKMRRTFFWAFDYVVTVIGYDDWKRITRHRLYVGPWCLEWNTYMDIGR
jgi:hypothetical protein